MLWLAGLMGLMAVGSVAFVETSAAEAEDAPFVERDGDADTLELSSGFADSNSTPDMVQPAPVQGGSVIIGSDLDDALAGTDGDDQIGGNDGNDIIAAHDGADDVYGADGDDTLDGGAGDDSVHGGAGNDVISGGGGDDELYGHNENDTLYGGDDNDTLQGSAGDDVLLGGAGDDALHGGLDNDTLDGGAGEDTLFGGWGNDLLIGANDNSADFLNGGQENDTIIAGDDDIITSGSGADQLVLGDWISEGHSVQVVDFASQEDDLLLIWDDSLESTTEPEIGLNIDPDTPDETQILMGDMIVARIGDGLLITMQDIALMPLSSAVNAGLTPAG